MLNVMSDFFLVMVMRFFLEIVVSLTCSGGYMGKSVILSLKVQLIEFYATISCDFLAVAIAALVRQWLHVSHRHRKQKNRLCSRGFKPGPHL